MRPNLEKPALTNPAYELSRKIYINSNGPLNEVLSHKYNLLNILHHEDLHRLDTDGITESFLEHALVYFGQIQHSSFDDCTFNNKASTLIGYGVRLLNHFRDRGLTGLAEQELNQNMNNVSSATSDKYRLTYEYPDIPDGRSKVDQYLIKFRINGNWYPPQENKRLEDYGN